MQQTVRFVKLMRHSNVLGLSQQVREADAALKFTLPLSTLPPSLALPLSLVSPSASLSFSHLSPLSLSLSLSIRRRAQASVPPHNILVIELLKDKYMRKHTRHEAHPISKECKLDARVFEGEIRELPPLP